MREWMNSALSLEIFEWTKWWQILPWIFQFLLKSLIFILKISWTHFVLVLDSIIEKIMTSGNRYIVHLPSNRYAFYFFSLPVSLARSSRTILNKSNKIRCPSCFLTFSGISSILALLFYSKIYLLSLMDIELSPMMFYITCIM